jgi:hypothetical protein
MTHHPPRIDRPVATNQVWSDLSLDLQARAIRLLAQLAYARARAHLQPPVKETKHGDSPQHLHDSSRSP